MRGPDAMTMLRMLQLASPTLPVGAYAYSQGLEQAVDARIVIDRSSACAWIRDAMELVLSAYELPCLAAMLQALSGYATTRLQGLNADFLASRETAELRAETVQMGRSLARLAADLRPATASQQMLDTLLEPSFPCAFAAAATSFGLAPREALPAYVWSWLENQVLAAVKLVPLGQSAGQQILHELAASVPALIEQAIHAEHWSNLAPGLALASARHETQYSRLFRS